MATTYEPTLPTAKDRVRMYIDDRSSPWRYQDEEIVATIAIFGEGEAAEIQAAIQLLESSSSIGSSTTQKQGTWSRTTTSKESHQRLLSLRGRLALLGVGEAFSGVGSAEVAMPTPDPLPIPRGRFYVDEWGNEV